MGALVLLAFVTGELSLVLGMRRPSRMGDIRAGFGELCYGLTIAGCVCGFCGIAITVVWAVFIVVTY